MFKFKKTCWSLESELVGAHIIGSIILFGFNLVMGIFYVRWVDVISKKGLAATGVVWAGLTVGFAVLDRNFMGEHSLSLFPEELVSVDTLFIVLNVVLLGLCPKFGAIIWNRLRRVS